ncbi:MAG: hypothetical protein U0Q47_12760 [Mycobacterium sp.]
MDTLLDGVFHGLFSAVDPLGMVLRTLMALLADALAQVATGMYSSLFAVTSVDLQQAAVANIWRITTGLSASLATILLVIAAVRSMLSQSKRVPFEAGGPSTPGLRRPRLAASMGSIEHLTGCRSWRVRQFGSHVGKLPVIGSGFAYTTRTDHK